MKKEKSSNKKVASFRYKKRKYEIDLLTDIDHGLFNAYEIFDVTDSKQGESISNIEMLRHRDKEYSKHKLIVAAIEEIKIENDIESD